MPEYLAPGVFVEEVSYRSKSIEGVSTTTTGFVGPTRYGPTEGELEVLTSLADFERTYGDGQPLVFADVRKVTNFMWQAARTFFEQGGTRLYVKRSFNPQDATNHDSGKAWASLGSLRVWARFPGAAGGGLAEFTLSTGPNVFSATPTPQLNSVQEYDVVWISGGWLSPPTASTTPGDYYVAAIDPTTKEWQFEDDSGAVVHRLADLDPGVHEIRILTVAVTFTPDAQDALPVTWSGLPLDPRHTTAGAPDSVFSIFSDEPPTRALARTIPIALRPALTTGLGLLEALATLPAMASPPTTPPEPTVRDTAHDPNTTAAQRTVEVILQHGDDGIRPVSGDYEGEEFPDGEKSGLKAFEDIDDISIVAAPGSTYEYATNTANADAIIQALIGHAERMRYRIAVIDAGDDLGITDVSEARGKIDTTHAALYYPWVTVMDPIMSIELNLPPSGFVAGIYARNDIERAVYKAPANEVVTGAIGFEKVINKAQQEVLNPLGVNCFRFFEGRGFRLWGARTATSDPEWKYVNLRRYFAYLEHSIDKGTQWAVFEPNGEKLWANVRRTISDFLFNEFQNGALLGDKPEEAYFVRCDRSTMTQNDLDNGRLVCKVGVAPLRPAEFVIFRIGQWTADKKS
jgi:phage tail sheath protein FI